MRIESSRTSTSEREGTWLGKKLEAKVVSESMGFIEINGVRGYLLASDISILFEKAGNLPANGVIVEIGSFMGLSALIMATSLVAAKNFGARIYCVDTWEGSMEHQEMEVIKSRQLFEVFAGNIRDSGLSSFIRPIRNASTDAALDFPEHSIDLLFVDGDHSFEGCYSDLESWYPKLKTQGIFLGHDYHNNDVRRAVERFSAEYGLIGTLPKPESSSIYEMKPRL